MGTMEDEVRPGELVFAWEGKPVRLVVDGNVTTTAGTPVSADPVLAGAVAGVRNGPPSTPGRTGAPPITLHHQHL